MDSIRLTAMLTILILAFIQNISFSIVSRSRNRNNMKYHLIAAFFSNTIWFLTFRALIKGDMNFVLFMPYCVGTMCGSLCGVKISMFIEKLLGASADQHLKTKASSAMDKLLACKFTADDLVAYWAYKDDPKRICYMTFIEWFNQSKGNARNKDGTPFISGTTGSGSGCGKTHKLLSKCPACHTNPIAPGRDTCVDCNH